jgi:hypothetical protein
MRKCIVCGEFKNESEFGWRNTEKKLLQSVCTPCRRAQMKTRYENHPENVKLINMTSRVKARSEAQKFVADYLIAHPCVDCGESDPVVLTFDHNNGNNKMNVADMVSQGYSLKAGQEEVNKCVIRCFNCHMRAEFLKRKKRLHCFLLNNFLINSPFLHTLILATLFVILFWRI